MQQNNGHVHLHEPLVGAARSKIEAAVPAGEELLIRVYSDLTAERTYGAQWLLVTPQRVVLVPEKGEHGLVDVPIEQITRAHTEPLVGGGRLEIERRDAPTLFIPYSSTLADKFSEVTRGIEQLRKGEPFYINARLDRTRCEKCRRLLPEKNGICPACVRRLATMGRIVAFIKPYKNRAAVLAVASLATTAAGLLPPLITRRLVDDVLVPTAASTLTLDQRFSLLGWLVLALIGVRVLSWLSELLHHWVVSWLSARVTADIRSELYRRLEMLSLQFYDKRQVGGLISRVTRDSSMLQDFLVDGLPYMVINLLMVLGILGLLFSISWKIALLILLPVPLTMVWSFVFWRRMRNIFNKWGHGWSLLSTRLNEALHGIRVVKAFAQEQRELLAFDEKNEVLGAIARRVARNWFVMWSTMELMTGIGILIVWYFGGGEVLGDQLSIGDLLAIYSFMWMVYGPLEWMAQVASWMTRAFAGAERIFEVIDAPPEAYEDPDAEAITFGVSADKNQEFVVGHVCLRRAVALIIRIRTRGRRRS